MSESEEAQPLRTTNGPPGRPFSRAGLVLLGILAAVFFWFAGRLLLLVFAGVLFAIFLRTGAGFLSKYLRLPSGWSLLLFVLLLLGGATTAGWLFAPSLAEQARDLTEAVPKAYSQLTDRLRETTWGGWVLDQVEEGQNAQEDGAMVGHATTAAWRLIDGIVAFVVVLFVGLYLAVDPQAYVRGVLRLVPMARRRRAGEVLYATGYQLRWWLLGQLLSMIVVGLIMGIGLAFIGVPLAFALGVLAGLLEFIPTIGPPLAVIPALLLALVDEPQKALYVLILYAALQIIESYLLTPLVQQRAVHLKPVVTITAQVFFAWTFGAIGILIAVPLIAAVQVAVQMWYVEDLLSDNLKIVAEREGRRELEEDHIFG
ncbi:AI-2E family transporter [soil metagenome]